MSLTLTKPAINQFRDDVADAIDCFIDKACRESGYQRGRGAQPPLITPDLVANIEAEARGEGVPAEVGDAAAANYAKLGIPYAEPMDNTPRLYEAGTGMFADPEAPTLLADPHAQPPLIMPTLEGMIANEIAERRRGGGKAAAAPAPGEQPAYVAPEMCW